MREVAVTGLGCVTPCGNSPEALWASLCAGRSGIRKIEGFDTKGQPVHIGGEVRDFVPDEFGIDSKNARRLDLFVQYAMAAASQALVDAGLAVGGSAVAEQFDPESVGVIIGTGIGGVRSIEAQVDNLIHHGPRRVSPTLVPSAVPDVGANEVALMYGFKGLVCAVSTACSSGNDALAFAARCIRDGTADVVVAGGSEAALTPLAVATFGNLKALTRAEGEPTKACRPFDRDRSGFVMGEGAGVLVLEAREHAEKRGARIHAILAGYGQTCDSYHKTAPDPEAVGASRAIAQAIRMARLDVGAIDYVNAHGTSTISNDPMETLALKTVLREHAYKVAVSSTKSMTGHLIGAAGAVEAIITILALRHNVVPPTLNLDNPDPECDLDYVPYEPRERRVDAALSSSFGFGGHNAAVVFTRP